MEPPIYNQLVRGTDKSLGLLLAPKVCVLGVGGGGSGGDVGGQGGGKVVGLTPYPVESDAPGR